MRLILQNAADLILTEPGLSPIYGAVLESRRIFARIKAYVVYRIAASIILVLTLSSIIFASGCAVNSLFVIILALLNDISMIPVAYDNAEATAKPQLPNARKLVLMSLFYGVTHTALALMFIFLLDHDQSLANEIRLERECDAETKGFIWLYLVLVTEFMIFSARAPNYFFQSMPSLVLTASVILTCILGTLIAVFASDLSWLNVAWIWLFNVGTFMLVDILKVQFRKIIKDTPGEIIATDELVQVELKGKTETKKFMEKNARYSIHRESQMNPADLAHNVEVLDNRNALMRNFSEMRSVDITDGFVQKRNRARELSNVSSGAFSRD